MNRLGIELLCVFGMPPAEHVRLAAELGCGHISSGLSSFPTNPHGYPPWSLKEDAALRREMIAAMRDTGVFISLGEGLLIRPGIDVRDREQDLDIMAELGVRFVNCASLDSDPARTLDQIALQVEMAGQRGMASVIEFAPVLAPPDLPSAVEIVRKVGDPNLRLLIDTMHLIRSGGTPADLAALDPDSIGYIQLCDVPVVPENPDYMREAAFGRLCPGKGELPLAEILAALPRHLLIGLEVPMYKEAEAGIGPRERVGPSVEASRRLLAALA